ncbi:putative nuclease HARBI1 [Mercenaria mercenaria]|uniref:putative nuclease HARBI1 n=1 Tax=Mercenaria mercenaria TaxID=6596 RepID=UPI00234F9904|nr:putative nuclease HARBI1 [Mercenaria mercenaria]
MGDKVTIAKFLCQINTELVRLARNLVDLEDLEEQEKRENRIQRRWWTRDWLLLRPIHGQYEALMAELQVEDHQVFQQFLRVDVATFYDILARIEGRITKQITALRYPISPALKLAFTLRYLATRNAYRDLRFGFRVAHNTMSGLIVDVCQALIDVIEQLFVKLSTEPEEWQQVAQTFQQKWQFPHTLGALDGKHIRIKKPPHSGSIYHNYKGFDSIVLMALVDAKYRFLWTQIGDVGSSSDGQIWNHCDLRQALEEGVLGVPDADLLPGDDVDTPYYIIGDDAFAMRTWLMKPFPY